MRKVLLIRYGEIHLKGKNRPYFEKLLVRSINSVVNDFGGRVLQAQGRFYVEDYDSAHENEVIDRLTRVFGIHSISVAAECDKDWNTVCETAIALLREQVVKLGAFTFKVNARRSDKTYPMCSMEMAPKLGGVLLDNIDGISVDVHHPQMPLGLEIRERAYLYTGEIMGAGGMPSGSNGKAALLLSGGIDSPVAGHMILKRGVAIECIHFHSFPHTSERAKDKVIALTRILARYCGSIKLHVVYFTKVQEELYEKCPESQLTVLMRRAMMQISQRIAVANGAVALITGEAIGQVASQTIESLCVTDDAVSMPVFRPCIGFDKIEIMDRARSIGTYDTSILPYEDCCTVFTPRHPVTHPRLKEIQKSELLVDLEMLIQGAIERTETIVVNP